MFVDSVDHRADVYLILVFIAQEFVSSCIVDREYPYLLPIPDHRHSEDRTPRRRLPLYRQRPDCFPG